MAAEAINGGDAASTPGAVHRDGTAGAAEAVTGLQLLAAVAAGRASRVGWSAIHANASLSLGRIRRTRSARHSRQSSPSLGRTCCPERSAARRSGYCGRPLATGPDLTERIWLSIAGAGKH